MRKTLLLFIVFIFTASYAFGSRCLEPLQPICLEKYTTFDKESCKQEVDKYIKSLEEWAGCIAKEAKEKAEKIEQIYYCRASGEQFCY